MTKKFMRKLVVVLLDLVILVLIEVQANDMASTSFHTSSLPISLPFPFKLDNEQLPFSICFEEKIEECKKTVVHHLDQQLCVVVGFSNCERRIHPDDPMLYEVSIVEKLCRIARMAHFRNNMNENKPFVPNHSGQLWIASKRIKGKKIKQPLKLFDHGGCLIEKYERNIKHH